MIASKPITLTVLLTVTILLVVPQSALAAKRKYALNGERYGTITLSSGATAACFTTQSGQSPEPGRIKQKRGQTFFIPTNKRDQRKIGRLKKKLKGLKGKKKAQLRKKIQQATSDLAQKKRMCTHGFSTPDQDPEVAFAAFEGNPEESDLRLLLERAAFGTSYREASIIDAGISGGIPAAVAELYKIKPEVTGVIAEVEDWLDGILENEDEDTRRNEFYGMRTGWLHLLMHTRNPFREKLGLFLWSIWGAHESALGYNERDYMWDHITLVREFAYQPDLREFVRQAAVNPMMLRWLDNGANVRGRVSEKFASAFLHAFMLGREAYRSGEFNETDIRRVAEAFSGWQLVSLENGLGETVLRPFFVSADHVAGGKTLFRGTSYQCNVEAEEDVYDCLFNRHTGTAKHYARRLLQFYLTPRPSEDLVSAFALVIKEKNFDLGESLKVLFLSNLFYADQFKNTVVKNPVEIGIEWLRTIDIPVRISDGHRGIRRQMDRMGMSLTAPRTPGWFAEPRELTQDYFLALSNFYAGVLLQDSRFLEVGWAPAEILPEGEAFSREVILYAADKLDVNLNSNQVEQLRFYMDYELDNTWEPVRRLYDNILPSHQERKGLGIYMLLGMSPEFVTK
jgi:hypothetical protein